MPSNHLILCHPLLPPSIFPNIRVFSNDTVLPHQVAKVLELQLQHQSFQWIPKDWSPLGWTSQISFQSKGRSRVSSNTSLKASILQCSAFFIVQLSHPYMTTGNTIALTRQTFVGKVISLLFNILSRFVRTFLPRSKLLIISWLQSPSAVILERPQNKFWHCFPIYLPWSDDQMSWS